MSYTSCINNGVSLLNASSLKPEGVVSSSSPRNVCPSPTSQAVPIAGENFDRRNLPTVVCHSCGISAPVPVVLRCSVASCATNLKTCEYPAARSRRVLPILIFAKSVDLGLSSTLKGFSLPVAFAHPRDPSSIPPITAIIDPNPLTSNFALSFLTLSEPATIFFVPCPIRLNLEVASRGA